MPGSFFCPRQFFLPGSFFPGSFFHLKPPIGQKTTAEKILGKAVWKVNFEKKKPP